MLQLFEHYFVDKVVQGTSPSMNDNWNLCERSTQTCNACAASCITQRFCRENLFSLMEKMFQSSVILNFTAKVNIRNLFPFMEKMFQSLKKSNVNDASETLIWMTWLGEYLRLVFQLQYKIWFASRFDCDYSICSANV